jgi:hypothetical protein
VGVLIYSDPGDGASFIFLARYIYSRFLKQLILPDGEITVLNGYESYPNGPARHPSSVQRGSVQALSIYPGDPLTPGKPAYKDADRLDRDDPELNIPQIPSLPISYQDALPLLKSLNGLGEQIEDWEGGLKDEGVQYSVGPGEGQVELENETDEAIKPIWVSPFMLSLHDASGRPNSRILSERLRSHSWFHPGRNRLAREPSRCLGMSQCGFGCFK